MDENIEEIKVSTVITNKFDDYNYIYLTNGEGYSSNPEKDDLAIIISQSCKPDQQADNKIDLWHDINQVPQNIIKARKLYAEGWAISKIAKKMKRNISAIQIWMNKDPIDWGLLRKNYHIQMTANALYKSQLSQLEQVNRIQQKVDEILEEADNLKFRDKKQAIDCALALDDRRRLLLGEKTSNSADHITLTYMIKLERQAKEIMNKENEVNTVTVSANANVIEKNDYKVVDDGK